MAGVAARSAGRRSAGNVSTGSLSKLTNGTPEIGGYLAAIDQHADAGDEPAARAHDIDGFLHPAAARDYILNDDERFARADFKSAPQHQTAFFLFGEDVALIQCAADLVTDDNPTERGRNDRIARHRPELFGQSMADAFRNARMLEDHRALEKLPAMEAGPQDEMAIQQRVGISKAGKDVSRVHGRKGRCAMLMLIASVE